MTAYELRFTDSGIDDPPCTRFEAEDASAALIIAHREASDRSAELWRGGEKVCTIDREPTAGPARSAATA